MASSFLGLPITLTLHSGQTLRGKVADIEPDTGRLTIESNAGVRKTLARDEIRDLQLNGPPADGKPSGATPAVQASGSAATMPPPAPVSDVSAAAAAAAAPSASSLPPPPKIKAQGSTSTNAASLAQSLVSGVAGGSSSDARAPAASSSPRISTAQAKSIQAGNSATPPPQGKGKGPKAKAVKESAQQPAAAAGLDEDFDFAAGLKSFDKKSVWEEIRSSSNTDPSQLLVSHNLRSAASPMLQQENGVATSGRGRARHPQEKLRNDENVLSPSPEREGQAAAVAPLAAPVLTPDPAPTTTRSGETSTALEKRLQELQARYAVLQALSGIELEAVPSKTTSSEAHYVATIWESVSAAKKAHTLLASAKAKGKKAGGDSSKGALRFEVAASISAPSISEGRDEAGIKALRYLGPRVATQDGSDEALVSKLPQHCRRPASAVGSMGVDGEEYQGIGLGTESAGVFVKRLRDAISAGAGAGAGAGTNGATGTQ